jgi:hypothetical protein
VPAGGGVFANGIGRSSMKAYLMTSGAMFGLLVVAHLLRILAEGLHVARDPWFVLSTTVSGVLCFWALRLLRLPAS